MKGISLAKKGSFDNAMKCYRHALDIDPNFTQAYVARGAAYVLQGQLKQACAEFEHALQIDPQQAYALTYLQAAKDKLAGRTSNAQPTAGQATKQVNAAAPTGAHSTRDSLSSTPAGAATAAVPSSTSSSRSAHSRTPQESAHRSSSRTSRSERGSDRRTRATSDSPSPTRHRESRKEQKKERSSSRKKHKKERKEQKKERKKERDRDRVRERDRKRARSERRDGSSASRSEPSTVVVISSSDSSPSSSRSPSLVAIRGSNAATGGTSVTPPFGSDAHAAMMEADNSDPLPLLPPDDHSPDEKQPACSDSAAAARLPASLGDDDADWLADRSAVTPPPPSVPASASLAPPRVHRAPEADSPVLPPPGSDSDADAAADVADLGAELTPFGNGDHLSFALPLEPGAAHADSSSDAQLQAQSHATLDSPPMQLAHSLSSNSIAALGLSPHHASAADAAAHPATPAGEQAEPQH